MCRNRAKRRLRGLYRKYRGELKDNFDIVMVARAKTAVCSYEKLEAAFLRLAAEIGILNETKGQSESL